jgi:HEXXH motif-containing protein
MIANYAPFYAPWVSYVVRDLIPVPARLAVANSASGGHTPGAICIANRPDPCALAEILVHEATHQYLHILTRLGPLDDGTDETLYFSPFRNALRPVYYILVAYHAFANVLLFYSMAQAHGLSVDQYGAGALPRMQRLKDGLEQLERALDATPALTPFGRALWEPLHDQLRRPLGGP